MAVLKIVETTKERAPSGRPIPLAVDEDAHIWSTFEHWCDALRVPASQRSRFNSTLKAACIDEKNRGNVCEMPTASGSTVFRWQAISRALEGMDREYYAEQYRPVNMKQWSNDPAEREARDELHRRYDEYRDWGRRLEEGAIAARLKQLRESTLAPSPAAPFTPQMLVEAIRQAVAPRLHAHDEKIAEHDVVIEAVKEAAPFLRDQQEFISIRQGAMELGLDPAWMPLHPQSRLNICGLVGQSLAKRAVETGPKVVSRLDGSAATAEMNTYRRGDVYAALKEVAAKPAPGDLPLLPR